MPVELIFARQERPAGLSTLDAVRVLAERAEAAAEAAGDGAVENATSIRAYDNLAALQAETSALPGKAVMLKGLQRAGDAPPRLLIYDAEATAPADGATVFEAPALPGRFLFADKEAITWLSFGADPTGVLDSTESAREALTWARNNGVASVIPAGTFRISGQLVDYEKERDGNRLNVIVGSGEGLSKLSLVGPIEDYLFKLWGPVSSFQGQSQLTGVSLRDFSINGDGVNVQRVFDLRALSYFSIANVRSFRCRGTNLSLKQCWEGYLGLKMVRGGQCIKLPFTGTMAAGQTITGATSGATAWVSKSLDGVLSLAGVQGTFLEGETITGATTAVAGVQTGQQEHVASFEPLFTDASVGSNSSSNNLELPKGFQIEAAEWECLYVGPHTRKVTALGSKFHYDLTYSYNFPAIRIDQATRNAFYGLNVAWGTDAAGIVVEMSDPASGAFPVENVFLGNNIAGGIEFRNDCRRNVVVGNSGTTATGRAAYVTFDGGMDNEVYANTTDGGVAEVAFTGRGNVKARGGVIRLQSGEAPAGGWSPNSQVHINSVLSNVAVATESTGTACYQSFRNNVTTIAPRAGSKGNSYFVQTGDQDSLQIEDTGRITLSRTGAIIRFRSPANTLYGMTVLDGGQPTFDAKPLATRVAVPALPTSPGMVGQWASNATHVYFCHAPDTWRRAALETWAP